MNPTTAAAETGEFIAKHASWDWYITLTHRGYVTTAKAKEVVRRWLRFLARDAVNEHLIVAIVTGRKPYQAPHHHLLLALPWRSDVVSKDFLHRSWRSTDPAAGITAIERYDGDLGAAWYIGKHAGGWDLRTFCPRRGRCAQCHGCAFDDNPWH